MASTVITAHDSVKPSTVKIVKLPWYAMIGIRVLRLAIFVILGNLGNGALTGTIAAQPTADFITLLRAAVDVSVGPIVVSLMWNALEILKEWDIDHPQMRA